jgi:hypothetical protein
MARLRLFGRKPAISFKTAKPTASLLIDQYGREKPLERS